MASPIHYSRTEPNWQQRLNSLYRDQLQLALRVTTASAWRGTEHQTRKFNTGTYRSAPISALYKAVGHVLKGRYKKT